MGIIGNNEYKIYDLEKQKYIQSRDVQVLENKFHDFINNKTKPNTIPIEIINKNPIVENNLEPTLDSKPRYELRFRSRIEPRIKLVVELLSKTSFILK